MAGGTPEVPWPWTPIPPLPSFEWIQAVFMGAGPHIFRQVCAGALPGARACAGHMARPVPAPARADPNSITRHPVSSKAKTATEAAGANKTTSSADSLRDGQPWAAPWGWRPRVRRGVSLEALHQRLGLRQGPDRLASDRAQAGTSGEGPPRGRAWGLGGGQGLLQGQGQLQGHGQMQGAGGGAGAGAGQERRGWGLGRVLVWVLARNLRWLWENCLRVSEGGQSHFSSDELSLSVLKLLRSSQHGDEVSLRCQPLQDAPW